MPLRSELPVYRNALDWAAFRREHALPDVFAKTVYRWAPERLRELARATGGHATLFRSPRPDARHRLAPLDPVLARIHRGLKQEFDPAGVLNPGRLYPDL